MTDPPAPTQISATDALEMLGSDAMLLDVREEHEWVAGHAPQALHIAMSQLQQRSAELPTDRTIVCVCHIGGRSAVVTDALNRSGWTAVNLIGGMEAWAAAGLPVIDGNGNPGSVG